MVDIFVIIGPLLVTALLGYSAAKTKVFTPDQIVGLGRFLITVAIPAVLILSLSSLSITEVIDNRFLRFYLVIALILVVLMWLVGRFVLGGSLEEAATMALAVGIPNNIIIGFPLVHQVFGDASLPFFVAVVLIENAILLPLALLAFEASSNQGQLTFARFQKVGKRVLGNPIILAVLVGLACSLTGMTLPGIVVSSFELLASAVTGLALFYVGASLVAAGGNVVENLTAAPPPKVQFAHVLSSVGVRLIGGPALAITAIALFPLLNDVARTCLILFCAPPCFSILPGIAAPYGTQMLGAKIQVAGTVLSAVSLTVVMVWII